ncbi:hypothetical protein KLEP7_gp04 [Pseudaeromonas phage vB_PpeM_ KLEP7]|nr:hypothetical protein KLEP7_gp04 [Pseudaeromonas phage vB_PpeM_ KLEP7]
MANTYFTRSDVLVQSVDEAGHSYETVTVALAAGLVLGSVLIDPEGDGTYRQLASGDTTVGTGQVGVLVDHEATFGTLATSGTKKLEIAVRASTFIGAKLNYGAGVTAGINAAKAALLLQGNKINAVAI